MMKPAPWIAAALALLAAADLHAQEVVIEPEFSKDFMIDGGASCSQAPISCPSRSTRRRWGSARTA
jgi:hypothetical protein